MIGGTTIENCRIYEKPYTNTCTLYIFVKCLRVRDVGPKIGRSTSILKVTHTVNIQIYFQGSIVTKLTNDILILGLSNCDILLLS